MNLRVRIACAIGALAAFASQPLFGQAFTGSISGLAQDSTGAAIVGTSITVTDLDKNTQFHTTSNETGFYVVSALPPGRYRVTAEHDGFRAFVVEPLVLTTQEKAELNIRLEIGAIAERVEVSAQNQLLEQESSTLSSVMESRLVRDLPLNGRNVLQLSFAVPGVFPESPMAQAGSSFTFMSNRFMIAGGQNETNDILVDGVSASVPHNNPALIAVSAVPSVEGVQEFRVQTNAFSAEYGRSGGGLVTLVTRSGSNEIHGSLFEFLRNSVMDSNSWQANRAGLNLASFKRNQFGFSLGGPVYIPKVYNGRNRTFFFVVFDADRPVAAATGQYTVPTPLERQGDFSQTFAANGQPRAIYNPFSIRPDPARPGNFIAGPFAGNRLPSSMINPVAANAAKYYPQSNTAGQPFTHANNFIVQTSSKQPTNRFEIKLDHNFNDRQRMFVRYTLLDTVTADPNYWNDPAMPNNGDLFQRMQNGALDYTRTLSPSAVLNLRYGFGRIGGTRNPPGTGFDPTQLGFPASIAANADQILFPTFTIQDLSQLGPSSGAYWRMRNYSHSFIGNVTKVLSRHSLKAGVDARLNYVNFLQEGSTTGGYSFSRAQTQGPDPRTPSTVGGDGFASFLLGVGSSGNFPTTLFGANSNRYLGLYVNDDFKVSQKLTLNIGLRWDFETGVNERYNRIGGIDPLAANPLSAETGLNLAGGWVYPGKGIDGRGIRPVDPHEINPRFGFAYALNAKTVIRSAYGIFFGVPSYTANPRFIPGGYSTSTAWVPLAADGVTPLNLLSNPFPSGFNQPTGSTQGLATQVGNALSGPWPASLFSNYNQQWNFTVQRSLSQDMALEVAYAGNKGTHLSLLSPVSTLDQLPTQLMSLGNALLQPVPNPFYGIITTGLLSLPTVQRGYLLRPDPEFTSVVATYAGWGNSDYHAFQAQLEKRYQRGLNFLIAYTWSKTITDGADGSWANNNSVPPVRNTYCRACDRSLSSFDQAHRFIASFTYELPVGRGKAFGASWRKWTDALFGQWQVNGVLTLSSGLPLVFSVPQNTSFSFGGYQSPDVTGGNPNLGSKRTVAEWFDTSQFSQPANFTFGTLGRVASNLRSDGARNLDFSIFKSFRVRERATLVLRAESFNLINHPEFSAPGTTVNTPLFGVVSSQANLPRQLQIGLKVLF